MGADLARGGRAEVAARGARQLATVDPGHAEEARLAERRAQSGHGVPPCSLQGRDLSAEFFVAMETSWHCGADHVLSWARAVSVLVEGTGAGVALSSLLLYERCFFVPYDIGIMELLPVWATRRRSHWK